MVCGGPETMLQEVEHRAKNSFAMAIALLRLQERRSTSKPVKEALGQAVQRLAHFARMHAALSHQPGDGQIEIPALFTKLCDEFAPVLPDKVALRLSADPIALDSQRALWTTLIVGEAINNSIKHAFPEGRPGSIQITLSYTGDTVSVAVQDDGVGSNGTNGPEKLGVRLMAEIARALNSQLTVDGTDGTRVSFSFLL